MVSDTLDYFQIRAGKFLTHDVPVNLRQMVNNAFELISIQMEQKNLQKIIDIDESLEMFEFMSDKQRLSQVLINLLQNAIKFTFDGFIKISVTEDIESSEWISPIDSKKISVLNLRQMAISDDESNDDAD